MVNVITIIAGILITLMSFIFIAIGNFYTFLESSFQSMLNMFWIILILIGLGITGFGFVRGAYA